MYQKSHFKYFWWQSEADITAYKSLFQLSPNYTKQIGNKKIVQLKKEQSRYPKHLIKNKH